MKLLKTNDLQKFSSVLLCFVAVYTPLGSRHASQFWHSLEKA